MKKTGFIGITTLIIATQSCTTPIVRNQQAALKANSSEMATQKLRKTNPNNKKDLLSLLIKLAEPAYEVTESEQKLITNISHQNLNSFETGIMVIISAQNAAAANPEAKISLEEPLVSRGIDIARALNKNIALKTVKIYGLILEAIKNSKDSDEFKAKVSTIITSKAEQWSKLLPEPEIIFEESITEDTLTRTPSIDTEPSLADLTSGDHKIQDADRLAENGRLKAAIKKLEAIPNTDPLFETAKQKSTTYSDRAVNLLRQKAAQAFQDALPLPKGGTKTELLSKAKNHLEKAIKDFPDASQMAKVKENLQTIVAGLEKSAPELNSKDPKATDTKIEDQTTQQKR